MVVTSGTFHKDNTEGEIGSMIICKKEVTGSNGAKKICKWYGAAEEYISHVKMCHNSSYYTPSNKGHFTFEWKTPFIGDQVDICILNDGTGGHILYHIYYIGLERTVCHRFWRITEYEEDTDHKIEIHNESGTCIGECYAARNISTHTKNETRIRHGGTQRDIRWTLRIVPTFID